MCMLPARSLTGPLAFPASFAPWLVQPSVDATTDTIHYRIDSGQPDYR